MPIDFEAEFGVNAGYVEGLFEAWRGGDTTVDTGWSSLFERLAPDEAPAPPAPEPQPAAAAEPIAEDEDFEAELLRGVAGKIVANMTASLDLPTATSVRSVPTKVLLENRAILNDHLRVRALGKASFTHLIAFALVRGLSENPRVQSAFEEREGKPYRLVPKHVNLGLAIDVPTSSGRSLVVPNIKAAEELDFAQFHNAYEDLVRRGRDGKLTADDFRGTTVTLTNPGGFGTHLSVPRLMPGQGVIIGVGSIGVPPEARGMSESTRADLAIGPIVTMTSTYDHRVIQGAESGLLLKRIDELLQGADGFYEEIFGRMRLPWAPVRPAIDHAGSPESERNDARESHAQLWSLINAYRVRGCRLADLDPLEYRPDSLDSLDPASYGFTVWDLDREFRVGGMCGREVMTLREILEVLRQSYCRRWTIEYMHISNYGRKTWLRERIENRRNEDEFGPEDRRRILTRLYRAENFERFLHTVYVGNKRFSLEGADTVIPALSGLIDRAAVAGVERVVIGMAHRGRLNVLVNILNKSYGQVFREFEGVLLPLSSEGSSDVKYHLGQRGTYQAPDGREIEVVLAANPSHLEAVDPVVCGMTRAHQDLLQDKDRKRVLAVLLHGDAAFSGQGVVAETLNMSDLRAFDCGGTIHIVVNNQIGFTASPRDLRSTYYCTDVAKSVQAPILHANGDYPESVLRAVHVAVEYQREFGRDAVIDMVCYRRWGHNEGDEPAYTQPVLYNKIKGHPTVAEIYGDLLVRREVMTREETDEIAQRFRDELQEALDSSKQAEQPALPLEEILDLDDDDPADWCDAPSPDTWISPDRLVEIIDRTNKMPEGHVTHPNLLRQLRRRERMVRGEMDLDWGCAEALAFGSILLDGTPIRLTGQDSGRGTFSHRHSVIRDQKTDAEFVPLAELAPDGVRFEAWDSLLSEEAVLGFEHGYALVNQKALVFWEAQFGDFANGAQIPIDQFIMAGESKWRETAGVILLLPHGYDGQGPEHSSARPERFLNLCSEGNACMVNCSTSAQYFHLLRRHARSDPKRPLIVLTPKSLLRDKRAASPIEDFGRGGFREVIDDGRSGAKRVILASGKIAHELETFREEQGIQDAAIVRVEQLYPFPRKALADILERHPEAALIWCQEEPKNMGAWSYVLQRSVDLD